MNRSKCISAAIAFLVAVASIFLIHDVSVMRAEPVAAPPRNATDDDGRFQLVMGEKHCFLLDTQTGQVWQKSLVQGAIEDSRGFLDQKVGAKSIK